MRQAWATFERQHPGRWKAWLDERSGMPTLVTGQGAVWFEPAEAASIDRDELELAAREFLGRHADLLGEWEPWLVRDDAANVSHSSDGWA